MTEIVQIGRAVIDGAVVALLNVAGRVARLSELLPDAPGVAQGRLDGLTADWDVHEGVLWRAAETVAADTVDTGRIERFLAPFERPPHLICIGANYHDHIAEMGAAVPQYPYAFLKPLTTIAAPAGPVALPSMSAMVDWEAELGVVVGRQARNVSAADALDVVAGYLPLNDVSARDWIESRPSLGIDWVMQKAHDDFTPLGGWMTLARSVPDPQALPIQCRLNGEIVQDSFTGDMVFSVARIIEHLSGIMTLSPGDIIATGTPAGVGFGRKPRLFIKPGDSVEVSVGVLGSLTTAFTASGA